MTYCMPMIFLFKLRVDQIKVSAMKFHVNELQHLQFPIEMLLYQNNRLCFFIVILKSIFKCKSEIF